MFVRSNGIELHVQQRGAGGPALVFLHYWGGSSRTWRHVIDALEPDFRTIAIDQRGWGQSEAPATNYALADLAADASGVIEALGLRRYILVGHSMGGKVAQLVASCRPSGIAGLVLVAPSPPSPLALTDEVRHGMVKAYATRETILETVAQVLTARQLQLQDLELVVADGLLGAAPAIAAWPLSASQEDITAQAAMIDVPTMVIAGAEDRVDPPDVLRRELLPHIPQAQFHLLPGVGHLSPLEAPRDIANLIRTFGRILIPDRAGRRNA